MPWHKLDNSDQTIDIVGNGDALYQRHLDGSVWRYTGVPLTGWSRYSALPATVQLAAGDTLYARDDAGGIWELGIGTSGQSWRQVDNNSATVEIAAGPGRRLYQQHLDGSIWRYTGIPLIGWDRIDGPHPTQQIVVNAVRLYKLADDGGVWAFVEDPSQPWLQVDDNPATIKLAAAGQLVHQLRKDGSILTLGQDWGLVDDNPDTSDIVAGTGPEGDSLYQLHADGSVWVYKGVPLSGWTRLDNDSRTVQLATSRVHLYQRHELGSIWEFSDTN